MLASTVFTRSLRSIATTTSIRKYAAPSVATLSASGIQINKTESPKTKPENSTLLFGQTFTDHMLEADWSQEKGWATPVIKPYGDMAMDPACTVFHYAMCCFEGMKAYKGQDGKVRLFRPDMNMRRLARSTQRIALPDFDQDQFLECIKELVKVDSAWIPEEKGYSLYLRPTAIGTQPSLGVGASKNAKMFVIMSPVGPYYKNGFAPVSLLADDRYNRAWPGGVGNYKIGGNYAPGVVPQIEAGEKGYDQLLWLSDEDHKVTEVGTMNFFVFWTNKAGEKELITAPLEGTILPGVTRDSIIDLAKQWGEFKVTEGWFTMKDLIEAQQEGRLIEAFGAGTACIVSPVKNIGYQGKDYAVPLAAGKSGELTLRVNNTISDIQYGDIESEWSVVVE